MNLQLKQGQGIKNTFGLQELKEQLFSIVAREHANYISTLIYNKFAHAKYWIFATRVAPDDLVENRPAWVEFNVWNSSGAVLTDVFVRASIQAKESLDPYDAFFNFNISEVNDGQSIFGAISFTLPRADTDNIITVDLCQYGEMEAEFRPLNILATDTIEFDVAARFSINMPGIFIRDTASHHEDTVFASLSGQFENTSYSDSVGLGDHNNTSGRGGLNPGLLPVGPFDMVPGSGSSVAISAVVANAGHTSSEEDAKKALEIVSTTGATIATVVMSIIFPIGTAVWAGLSAAIDQLNRAIIDWALADCDTVVLADGKLINEQELFTISFDPNDEQTDFAPPANWIIRSQKPAGTILQGVNWLGGGCRDSDYTVIFDLQRHRTPEMFHRSEIDGMLFSPGQEASFGPVGHDISNTMYDHEGNGKVNPLGVYKAPATISDRKFDVVKWTVNQQNKNGFFVAYQDFAIVLLD